MVYRQMQTLASTTLSNTDFCMPCPSGNDWNGCLFLFSTKQVASLPEPLRRRALIFDPILPPIHPRIGAPREFPVSTRLQPHWIEEVRRGGGCCKGMAMVDCGGVVLPIGERLFFLRFHWFAFFLFFFSNTSHKNHCCAKISTKAKTPMMPCLSVLHSLDALARV